MDPEIIQGGLMQNLGMDEGTAYRYAAEISASPELYGDVLAKIGLSDGFQARFRAANPRPAPYNPEAESESRQRELGAYQDPIRKWAVETLTGFGVPAFTQYNLLGAAEMAPGPGDVMAVQDAALATGRAYDNPTLGNIGEAAGLGLAAGVGAIPLAGDVFGPLIKTGLGLGTKAAGGRAIDALTAGESKDILGQATQEVGQRALPQLGGAPGRISTRLPTAARATEDPLTGELVIGLREMQADPKIYDYNVNITKDYPNMRPVPGASTDETAEQFINHVKDNLLYLHDQIPPQTRARSQLWYDGARNITDRWSSEYNVPDTSVSAVLAALSPQKDWYQNVSLGQRVLDVAVKNKDEKMTDAMSDLFFNLKDAKGNPVLDKPKYKPLFEGIRGKSFSEITHPDIATQDAMRALFIRLRDQAHNTSDYRIVGPEGDFLQVATNADGSPSKVAWGSLNEIGKAVGAVRANGDMSIISPMMGERHKVRNFYNNIYDPNSPYGDVTIDTHAVAAGLLRPLSGNSLEVDHNFKNMSVKGRGTTKGSAVSGVSGNYGLYAEAYRRAAQERGILPRQMQSITWEAARGLFTDKFKQSKKNVAAIDDIWRRYRNGDIGIDETRRLVNEKAGGINPPTWE
jgi:hypothetical protein